MSIYSDSLNWQTALNAPGVVEGVADVEQSIRIIVTTPQGSDPHRPLFGNPGMDYVDADPDVAALYLIRTTPDAILKWEPRVKSCDVTVSFDNPNARMTVKVKYVLVDGIINTVEITL